MALYLVDTDKGTCVPYINVEADKHGTDILNFMLNHIGCREYDGIIANAQYWFYGKLVKAPWCATWMCYAINQVTGVIIKQDNVYRLYQYAASSNNKLGHLYEPNKIQPQRGDIIFLCFDKNFTPESSKHVTMYFEPNGTDHFAGVGGNQSDMICHTRYKNENIVGIWRI